MAITPPWKASTPQTRGRTGEERFLKSVGAQSHAMSGAGRRKLDGSDDEVVYEHKEAQRYFSLTLDLIKTVFRQGHAQQKTPLIVVTFPGFRVTCRIERTDPMEQP